MSRQPQSRELSHDAVAIWKAGVHAVDAARLVRAVVSADDDVVTIAGERLPWQGIRRLAVVGAGKAGAGMAAGFEQAVGECRLLEKVIGWVNVPANCVQPLRRIHLHAARPAGVNEPTAAGVAGAERILQIVSELQTDDVCVVLLSGGGSALLPAPVEGITLDDKQQVTRLLMQAGAPINDLNCVRAHLSRIKGGRLAQACGAGGSISLIISDVIGDPLNVIASGPTVADPTTAADALRVLEHYSLSSAVPPSVMAHLKSEAQFPSRTASRETPHARRVIIGNIDVALRAASEAAERRGFRVHSLGGANAGVAREVGVDLAERCLMARDAGDVGICLLSGGEPVVQLATTDRPRSGGRNQELVLAAAERLWNENLHGIVILSGGTDGEDGPTDAAGAWVDAQVVRTARRAGLVPEEYLAINNSYEFFAQSGGHLQTGPTHTNVMDLRVCLIDSARDGG